MVAAELQLSIHSKPDRRREPRDPWVRRVEFSRFPRGADDPGLRAGYTRDLSRSGLCMRVLAAEPVGSLLRVMVRGADGRPQRHALARVAWSEPAGEGDHWLGLQLLDAAPAETPRVRRIRRRRLMPLG